MNVRFTPIGGFLHRADAEGAAALLTGAGIQSVVREANDCPEGYRASKPQVGFTLWVVQTDGEKALEVMRNAAPKPVLCDVCGAKRATEHVTIIRNGERETENLCPDCYTARSTT